MRTVVFRILAGLLSVAFGWLLLSGGLAGHPLREQWGAGVIAVAFALFAAIGPGLSERLLLAGLGYSTGDTMTQFKAVFPISNEDTNALPVKEIGPAVAFYETVLGFSVVTSDSTTAVLKRDDVQIGLIRKEDHDPKTAGSCYFSVNDVDALHAEFQGKDTDLGRIDFSEHEGKKYRVFFLREDTDGYCFCFGHPA